MMKVNKLYLILLFIGSILFGCKKYPENRIWSNKPEKYFKGGTITSYKINGVDRKQYFIDLYRNFPYNQYGSSIPNVFDLPFTYDSGSENLSCDYGEGTIKFSETKREVEIRFKPKNMDFGAENIFVRDLSWKVMKLTKDGQLKIQTQADFKLYEIQFN
jgi:hypothetical protein